jgi:nitroreductase
MTAAATRTAVTDADLHPILATRWSPRAFDASFEVPSQSLHAILEAARWAPSASNSQPWRFVAARRGESEFGTLFGTLAAGNQPWAGNASVLLLVAAETVGADGADRPWAVYDTGQAVAHLQTQAQAEGLILHQMGGFDRVAAAAAFALPATVQPLTIIAIGAHDPSVELAEPYASRESADRVRLPQADLLLRPLSA